MQVALPALHISLGIFERLFRLYEDACHELDIKLTTTATSVPVEANEAYRSYAAQVREIKRLNQRMEECLQDAERYEEVAMQLAIYNKGINGDEESGIGVTVTALLKEAHKLHEEVDSTVRNNGRQVYIMS